MATQKNSSEKKPWESPHWMVSPLNFHLDALWSFPIPDSVELHDVTLREADECAGAILQVGDKVEVARALARAGVQRIEVGLITPGSHRALERILAEGLESRIYAAGKLVDAANLDRAVACGVRHVTIGMRTSDLFIEHVLRQSREAVLEQARGSVGQAKDRGIGVNLFLADATRADFGFLEQVVQAAVEWGVDSLTMVDTLGVCHPQAFAYLIGQVRRWSQLPVEAHCHNDFGLGVATAISAVLAGASVVHVSVNGVGYRAGNPALDEVAVALKVLYGIDAGVRLEQLTSLSRLLAERAGLPVAYNKPLVGPGAFAYEQWGDLEKWQAQGKLSAGMPLDPAVVGNKIKAVLSKWSDTRMLKRKLSELNLALDGPALEALLSRVKQLVYVNRRPVGEAELRQLVSDTD